MKTYTITCDGGLNSGIEIRPDWNIAVIGLQGFIYSASVRWKSRIPTLVPEAGMGSQGVLLRIQTFYSLSCMNNSGLTVLARGKGMGRGDLIQLHNNVAITIHLVGTSNRYLLCSEGDVHMY